MTLSKSLGKDYYPKVCYKFLKINPLNAELIKLLDLTKEQSVFSAICNLLFEVFYDQRRGYLNFVALYRKSVYDAQQKF